MWFPTLVELEVTCFIGKKRHSVAGLMKNMFVASLYIQ